MQITKHGEEMRKISNRGGGGILKKESAPLSAQIVAFASGQREIRQQVQAVKEVKEDGTTFGKRYKIKDYHCIN